MTANIATIEARKIRDRIATKQAQQQARREHAAALQAVIDHAELEIVNLTAQLDRGVIACRPPQSDGAAHPAPSADDTSSKPKTNPSCPPTPTKPGEPAPCREGS